MIANRTVNVVCHGHSVPAGYFHTPLVDSFNAYPHLLHRGLKQRYPYAVINVITTAIGGENAAQGAARLAEQGLCHRPDVLTIDYALNDRGLGLEAAERAWRGMIEQALDRRIRLLLLTPTLDNSGVGNAGGPDYLALMRHAAMIRRLADAYETGLVDATAAFEAYLQASGDLSDLLSQSNHPNWRGHELVAGELLRWFPLPG